MTEKHQASDARLTDSETGKAIGSAINSSSVADARAEGPTTPAPKCHRIAADRFNALKAAGVFVDVPLSEVEQIDVQAVPPAAPGAEDATTMPTGRHWTDKELLEKLPGLSIARQIEIVIGKFIGGGIEQFYNGETDSLTAGRAIGRYLIGRLRKFGVLDQIARAASPAPAWQPIETAPTNEAVDFWIVPKTAAESYVDTSGKPIVSRSSSPHRFTGRFKTWGALYKATHWMPLPPPPSAGVVPSEITEEQ
jgi:hypothetical protein